VRLHRTLLLGLAMSTTPGTGTSADPTIDDRRDTGLTASHGGSWRLVTDQVMGGVSDGRLRGDRHQGRDCLRLLGSVSTANNGGFVQMVLDLAGGEAFDATAYTGIALLVAGNGERYNLHLRTSDVWLPWQSYRASFVATPEWRELRIPFTEFEAYRTSRRLRPDRLVRLGLVAIGRDFEADLCLGGARFYRDENGTGP
jgi:hypothetical protein